MAIEIFSTERLSSRTPIAGDLERLHAQVFSDAEIMRLAFGKRPFSSDRSEAFFVAAFDHDASGRKLGVLVEKASGELVGFSGLIRSTLFGERDYEIGFVLVRSAWGKGYATEIGHGQLRHGFRTVGRDRLLAQVDPQNTRSIAVLRKIGMSYHSLMLTDGPGMHDVYVAYRDPREQALLIRRELAHAYGGVHA